MAWLKRAKHTGRALLGRWQADLRGASLVQFVVVLPVFLIIILGLYSLFTVMSSRDSLCESAWEAARYLQVEGPHFPADDPLYDYPGGWERVATDIINQSLASRTFTSLAPVQLGDVDITPDSIRHSPADTVEVRNDPIGAVENAWFTLHVRKTITTPFGAWLGEEPGLGTLNLSCKSTGYFEGPPLGPTQPGQGGGGNCPQPRRPCDVCPGCTATTVGRNTPTVCPDCRQ